MVATGTGAFADFREGGLPGVLALMHAMDAASTFGCAGAVDAVILGRPGGGKCTGEEGHDRCDGVDEIDSILELAGGIGISSTNDYAEGFAAAVAERTRRRGGVFAIHAGELDSTDIRGALELYPDLLVHLVHASRDDLRRVAGENIPVVVCIRSNLMTRV